MDGQNSDIVIIGAGMAGLSCASALAESGLNIRLLDKGRGPGGRMAARRAEIAGEPVAFDHGAQYFTARDPNFQDAVSEWEKLGAAARWKAAGQEAWVGTPGMNGPIRAMAQPLDVRWNTRALSVSHEGEQWLIETGEERFTADIVLVAIPAEQASELLEPAAPDLSAIAAGVRSEPCWAVMAAFTSRIEIDSDATRDDGAPISWFARNSAKPYRSGGETWVLHASPARSREVLDLSKEEVAPLLLADFFRQTGIDPVTPTHLAAHRWLYAMAEAIDGDAARYDPVAGIGIAGDYLHSPRVEGAWLSGRALAEKVLGARRSG